MPRSFGPFDMISTSVITETCERLTLNSKYHVQVSKQNDRAT